MQQTNPKKTNKFGSEKEFERHNTQESLKIKLIAPALLVVLFLSAFSWVNVPSTARAATSAEDRAQLEQQLKELEAQIDVYNSQISTYQKQGKSLKGEIGKLDSKIASLNTQIKAVQLAISQLDQKIGDTQSRITVIQSNIDSDKVTLTQLLRNLQAAEGTTVMEVLLQSDNFSDFFGDVNNLTVLQDNLRSTIQDITDLKGQLEDQKSQLEIARSDAAAAQLAQQQQKSQTASTKQQKASLLAATQGQEAKYQQLAKATQAQINAIKNRLFDLLGGGAMKFEQAYQYAKFAQDATGVRAAFLLAILNRESALGVNVGQCSYQRAMNPKDQPIFLSITAALNINPNTQLVSCANADGQYGGAMGPAQFIPRTWQTYAPRVMAITGRSIASPWNNQDAFVAAALYLRDAGASSNEKTAAAKYYCGANWNRYVCTQVYGQRVVEQAAQFQQDIDTITQ
jgi:peptidoglycan hydrolase CwlO-like protein